MLAFEYFVSLNKKKKKVGQDLILSFGNSLDWGKWALCDAARWLEGKSWIGDINPKRKQGQFHAPVKTNCWNSVWTNKVNLSSCITQFSTKPGENSWNGSWVSAYFGHISSCTAHTWADNHTQNQKRHTLILFQITLKVHPSAQLWKHKGWKMFPLIV